MAGVALLLVALALLIGPWSLLVRPGPYATAAMFASALMYAGVGTATLRSGISGEVVEPLMGNAAVTLWFLLPTPVLVWPAVRARGPARAAAVFLAPASPLVMGFTYAIGPFDANPWYEASTGDPTALAGLCLLAAAASSRRGGSVPPEPLSRRSRGGNGSVNLRSIRSADPAASA